MAGRPTNVTVRDSLSLLSHLETEKEVILAPLGSDGDETDSRAQATLSTRAAKCFSKVSRG